MDAVAAPPVSSARQPGNATKESRTKIETATRTGGIYHLYPGGDGGPERRALQCPASHESTTGNIRIRSATSASKNKRPECIHSPTELLVEISGDEGDNGVLCRRVAAYDDEIEDRHALLVRTLFRAYLTMGSPWLSFSSVGRGMLM